MQTSYRPAASEGFLRQYGQFVFAEYMIAYSLFRILNMKTDGERIRVQFSEHAICS